MNKRTSEYEITDEDVEVGLAWLKGEIYPKQIGGVKGWGIQQQTKIAPYINICLKRAYITKKITINV